MKLLPVLLYAIIPAFASAETHVLCRTSGPDSYRFSFDEAGRSQDGVTFRLPSGKAVVGSRVVKYAENDFSFSVDDLSVRFNNLSWRAEFETPGYPDMEPPMVNTYQCEPDAAFVSAGEGI